MSEAPFRDAVFSVLCDDLREELRKAEAECEAREAESDAAKDRALDWVRKDRAMGFFEHREVEILKEHRELIAYHQAKLAKKIRWALRAWKDTGEE